MGETTVAVDQPFLPRLMRTISNRFQQLLDKSTPHTAVRWTLAISLFILYALRVYYLQGFYIVTYGLGIYLLNLSIGFLSPLDEETLGGDEDAKGPLLPLNEDAEFKPFIRRLPEFKFWSHSCYIIFSFIFFTLSFCGICLTNR